MEFHAYSKRQFAQSGFDTTGYHRPDQDIVGDFYARLDCKRWGKHCLIAYLTLDNGEKIYVVTWPRQNYFGFKEIPIGRIIDIGFDYNPDTDEVFLYSVDYFENGSPDQINADQMFFEAMGSAEGGNTGGALS